MLPFRKAAALTLLLVTCLAQAQLAQEPLLNRVNPVAPNVTLLMDDSSSMRQTEIYEYGKAHGLGPRGPGAGIYKGKPDGGPTSPDVNKLYYDPRVRYEPRLDFSGKPLPLGVLENSWLVYFRNGSGGYEDGQLTKPEDYHIPFYKPPAELVAKGSTASYPVSITSGTPPTTMFPKFIERIDCKGTDCTLAEEQRNYTIWKKWYSNRLDMAKTAIALAFSPIKADAIRLGFGTITDLAKSEKMARGVAPFREGLGETKDKFYSWLYGLNTRGGTPNIRAVYNAGKYYERADDEGPWGNKPNPNSVELTKTGTPAEKHATCRRSFTMLVTDGYWTDTAAERDVDGGKTKKRSKETWSITSKDGKEFTYKPEKPYVSSKKSSTNTLSDMAMEFWGRDLRPSLDNEVPELTTPAGKNESTWQNVSFYAVTLGLRGTLSRDDWAKLKDPKDKTVEWPDVKAGDPTTIDDTWHAAVNGRGELLNANTAKELTYAVKRMLQGMAGNPATVAGVAGSSAVAHAGVRKYKPQYLSGAWTGNLSAHLVDPLTGKELNEVWKVEGGADKTGEPTSTIPDAKLRKLKTWKDGFEVDFTPANTKLDTGLVNYLLGDTSKELRKAGGLYRNRDSKLGDIVNSAPLYVGGALDMGYEALPAESGSASYRTFVTETKAARAAAIFVGANDGMLHAFDERDGKEVFAYVPGAVRDRLAQLADTPYEHRYFVDGPNVEADAYLKGADRQGRWKNLLVGTTGAGAKAVYALDVTKPLEPAVKWEISPEVAGFAELGHVLSDVKTGVLPSGQWVAIFGNGYGSSRGTARLYVVDLDTGAQIDDIDVGSSSHNGLGAVTVVHDDKRQIIGAYAGDLQGTLWKFDLSSKRGSASPLFVPDDDARRPITAAPHVLHHPKEGRVVSFGTGKFFEEADAKPPYTKQRLYGVWDRPPFGQTDPTVTGTKNLIERRVTKIPVDDKRNFYRISVGDITWGDNARGWYLDLSEPGQRSIYPMQRLRGTFLLATTMSPVDDVERDICRQTGSGKAWSYIIDGITGSGVAKPALDTNSDGAINTLDEIASGYEHGADGPRWVLKLKQSRRETKYNFNDSRNGAAGQLGCGNHPGADACPVMSTQWRQVFPRQGK